MRSKRAVEGFTLVEVIIALTLMSMIMLALVGAFRVFAESGGRIQSRSTALDEYVLVPAFLGRVLSSATTEARRVESNNAALWFQGASAELQWLGIMPARYGMGGLSHFKLAVSKADQGGELKVQILPFVGSDQQPDWDQAESEVMVRDVVRFELAYRALSGEEWRQAWGDMPGLPGWVSVRLETVSGHWPLMIFRIMHAEPLHG